MWKTFFALLVVASSVSWSEAGVCGEDRKPYDDENEVCCSGKIYKTDDDWLLCYDRTGGLTSYDPRFSVCCDNRIVDITPTVDCCDGHVLYNPQTSTCDAANHRVVEKEPK
ncbi:hypothetical protein NP493_926g02063 [Ridgeia piscesae]|uniref:Galaxin-like repeats domain-containing protein n=1 Tax=Ridgeia piscesae TaxID=27915 RepID=A0AAD9NLL8_RIDPI|nr:hypothetical protein NP493_926g02063 [Ridgeia piscesae]